MVSLSYYCFYDVFMISDSLSNLIHNSNHLNDSILSNYSESNELKSEPIMSGERCTRVTHVKVKKKSTESKSTGNISELIKQLTIKKSIQLLDC